jgi:acetyltransferase-like isoleucine patch superfamily enzyme
MTGRTIPGDWYSGVIPGNVQIGDGAYVQTSYSFHLYRSRRERGIVLGENSSTYIGCMFDMGPDAVFQIGDFTLLNGLWLICDQQVTIGTHCLISWNVVIMDNFRAAEDIASRRRMLEAYAVTRDRQLLAPVKPQPVIIGNNVWIGFDCCILPGVHIGDGSIIGARSVVDQNIPACCMAAGNPARIIRSLREKEDHGG